MNKFRRIKGDTDNNYEGVDEMIQELRQISWSVLGNLDEDGLKGTCFWDKGDREARVWAIGHWYVHSRPLGRHFILLFPFDVPCLRCCPGLQGNLNQWCEADYQPY
jgi:hypothetical protein